VGIGKGTTRHVTRAALTYLLPHVLTMAVLARGWPSSVHRCRAATRSRRPATLSRRCYLLLTTYYLLLTTYYFLVTLGYFKQALLECDEEWSQHKKLYTTKGSVRGVARVRV
jgi:hypothetical protein